MSNFGCLCRLIQNLQIEEFARAEETDYSKYFNKGNDCDACLHQFLIREDAVACRKELKEELEAVLKILDDDKAATRTRTSDTVRNMKPPRTLAEVLEEGAGVSMSMKFNLLTALYMKTQRENDFTKEEVIFIQTLAKYAMRDITDEHYKDLLKIAENILKAETIATK